MLHGGKPIQFADAVSLSINGKDRVLSLGAEPKIDGPINKLPSLKLGGNLVKSGGSQVLASFDADSGFAYLLPQGTPKTAPNDPAGIWKTAVIAYKKSASDKTPTAVSMEEFVAYIADGPEGLAKFCMDERALEFAGGQGKGFAMQIDLLAAAVTAFGANPAMAPLAKYVEEAMRSRFDRFERGVAGVDVLNQALRFAELSSRIYPKVAGQEKLRQALRERKLWLDRKVAVLRAFAVAAQWDAYLLGYRDFEVYQGSFPDLAERQVEALKQSLRLHQAAGRERSSGGEYRAAVREFRLANARLPGDSGLQKELAVAWTEYSRRAAVDRQPQRKQLSVGQREAINQALHFATRYKEQNNLDDALKSVTEAEAIDPNALPVLLKKAEVLGARKEIGRALAVLDEYDQWAVDDERPPALQLRNELMFQLTNTLREARVQVEKAWNEMAFNRVLQVSLLGLRAKDDDPDLLYYAGMAGLVTRQPQEGRAALTRYLEVSNTLKADSAQRRRVRQVLSAASRPPAAPAGQGEPNWLSGAKLPATVYYDPVSAAFQPRIDHIEASNKMKESFEWNGAKLLSITPSFEKAEHATGEVQMVFSYDNRVPQVAVVAEASSVPAPSRDPDEALRNASIMLFNHPAVDPVVVERLTGRNLAQGIAGNRFFNPFVWEKVHYFQFTYDDAGRVAKARELNGRRGKPAGLLLEFEWIGQQLAGIRGFQLSGGDESKRSQIYERRMQYQDDRLVGEEIRGEGKTSRIKYIYSGDRLASANCEKDPSLDGRSRVVSFR